MSLSEIDSIEGFLQDSRKVLHSSLPLRHISQFYEDEKIREATDMEKENILKNFIEANPNLSTDHLKEELQNVIDEFVKKNDDHKSKSESFFKKQVDLICETFKMSSKAKLEINPEMDLKSAEEMIERGRVVAMKYFDDNWNLGNVGLLLTKKDELEKKLDLLGKEMLENQRLQLESMEVERVFEEVKAIILEMSRQVKCYVDTHEGKVSKQILQGRVQNIYDYLDGKGFVLNEKYESVWSKLIGTAKAAVTVLNNAEENMSAEECIRFAERLDTRVHILCSESEKHLSASTNGKEGNGLGETDDVEEPYEIIQDVHEGLESIEPTTSGTVEEYEAALRSHGRLSPTQHNLDISVRQVDKDGKVILKQRAKRGHQRNPEVLCQSVNPRRSKRLRQAIPENARVQVEEVILTCSEVGSNEETEKSLERNVKPRGNKDDIEELCAKAKGSIKMNPREFNDDDVDLNVPNKTGDFPLLRAIRASRTNIAYIKRMLESGADANVSKGKNSAFTAAHEAIKSLICNQRTQSCALSILNMLVGKGFNRINATNSTGETPLSYAMRVKDLDVELLNWFYKNGADFNNRDSYGESVLFSAIRFLQEGQIIRKIREFGDDPKFVDTRGRNALHKAAWYAHESALEILIGHLNVNDVDKNDCNPLHYLFCKEDLDYQSCLEILLQNEADFGMISIGGHVPLVKWMLSHADPYPTLMEVKDKLPLTLEIASAALTAMVGCDWFRVRKNEFSATFAQFFRFLEEKDAKIRLTKNDEWFTTTRFNEYILTRDFSTELRLRIGNQMDWKGDFIRYEASELGKVNFHTESGSVTVAIETVLVCLLACAKDEDDRENFVDLCRFLGRFCDYTFSH